MTKPLRPGASILLCPVRPGDDNEELRYSLRSWETNLLPGVEKHLIIVGYCPSWLRPDHFIKGNTVPEMDRVVFENVLLGASYVTAEHGAREVIVMNDDMFCLDPVTDVPKVRRNITLREHVSTVPRTTWWGRSLKSTVALAEAWGVEEPQSYEVHRPLVADSALLWGALLEAVAAMQSEGSLRGQPYPQWRTVYGMSFDGHDDEYIPVRDVKVLGTRKPRVGSPWLSTDEVSWKYLSSAIRKRFQNPSRWETQ